MLHELANRRLSDLIDYVEATERDRLKVELDYRGHRGFVVSEAEIGNLPGVTLDTGSEDDPIWFQVERLSKVLVPAPADEELGAWVAVRDDVDSLPHLKTEISTVALIKLGLIDNDDAPDRVLLADYEFAERIQESFAAWVDGDWKRWSDSERPRRDTIKLYNSLYMLRQQLEGVSDIPLEFVCGIGIASLHRDGRRFRYPLLTMALELSLDEMTHCIEARPRIEAEPSLEIDALDRMSFPSLEQWRSSSERVLRELDEVVLSPFAQESFEPVLRQAAALLDPDGVYVPETEPSKARTVPSIEPHLQVSAAFAFFQRERRATQLMDDLRRFKALLAEGAESVDIPEAVAALLVEPATAVEDPEYPQFRGVSTIPGVTSSDGGGQDLFFPKPFNREQVEVVQRLETRPGVVVQGPPGTGKTHTIANIISHYLALGKRVLVTSQKAPALRVLRDKLPAAVRPLAVSLLDSDRDGLKQFQESVDVIAEKLQQLRRHELERQIEDLDYQIDNLHRALARIDNEVDAIGRTAISPVTLDGEIFEPVRAARLVVKNADLASWLSDELDTSADHDAKFADSDIVALRQARRKIGADLTYLGLSVPRSAEVPAADALLAVHRDLSRAEELRRQIDSGTLPELRGYDEEAKPRLTQLGEELTKLEDLAAQVRDHTCDWTEPTVRLIRGGADGEVRAAIDRLRPEIDRLSVEASHFLTRPIDLPDDALDDEKFLEALSRLCEGKAAVGLVGGLFAGKLKASLAGVSLLGDAPNDADEWQEVQRFIAGLKHSRKLRQAWNNLTSLGFGDKVQNDGLGVAKQIERQLRHFTSIDTLIEQQRLVDGLARVTFVVGLPSAADGADAVTSIRETVETHQTRFRLEGAETTRARLLSICSACEGDISTMLQSAVLRSLGNPATSSADMHAEWSSLIKRLVEIEALKDDFETIETVCATIASSGATTWARALQSSPVESGEDGLTPGDWAMRWQLRRLGQWLSRIDRHDRLRQLGQERTEKEILLNRAYESAIELRTWLQLSLKATDGVKAALASYADAVRRIGKGTGKRAGRYRREARAASDRAKGALPCWIMPHYRVSESLPADLGLFDLVIVDEASQSTVAALPALLRAKKILIVGDDKQVSPELVGRDQARADELASRHLTAQVDDYRTSLREEQSLYDLGKVVFAGGSIMLAEHFRCVGPIIEFSKAQFYSHRLTPLRLPMASERLDPPLIDVFVEDGFRKGDVNPAEAEFIVREIGNIAADPMMANRSIGVTTLLGQSQAAHIFMEIEQQLGTEVMDRHDIRVGDPTAFQGDERDIMFVSLVTQRDDTALSGLRFEQRFNVALSRARDRTYLVRSVELDNLRPSDQLRRALLEHFRCPFPADGTEAADRRAKCESEFEKEMFDALTSHGYRVDTQVRVGNFRIDLVVEGEDDRRIAIECDGDRYHGPDKWPDDMMRQRILERAGWTVWRCFASRFVRNRDAVLDELIQFLSAKGIAPIADNEPWTSRHVELRRWRTPEADDIEEGPFESVDPSIPEPDSREDVSNSSTEMDHEIGSPVEAHSGTKRLTPSTDDQRVTESEVQRAILELMSNGNTWSNADLKRSLSAILPLSSADRAPANFRPGEEKWEELVNNALSPSRGNSLHSRGLVESAGRGLHVLVLTARMESDDPIEVATLASASNSASLVAPSREIGEEYRIANVAVPHHESDLIYAPDYRAKLGEIIDSVLETESPIYEDILVERIARAHNKDRAGRIIQETVVAAIAPTHKSVLEDGRRVIFHRDMDPEQIVAYRPARADWRSHRDIPIIELASLALPSVQSGASDEATLAHFGRIFSLARLRAPTRKRFEAAIAAAKRVGGGA